MVLNKDNMCLVCLLYFFAVHNHNRSYIVAKLKTVEKQVQQRTIANKTQTAYLYALCDPSQYGIFLDSQHLQKLFFP
jgi:hypothetical protein